MTVVQAVAKRINQLLEEKNMTPFALAKKAALDCSSIYNILNNNVKSIQILTLFQITDGFDMTIEEFLNSPIFDRENLTL